MPKKKKSSSKKKKKTTKSDKAKVMKYAMKEHKQGRSLSAAMKEGWKKYGK